MGHCQRRYFVRPLDMMLPMRSNLSRSLSRFRLGVRLNEGDPNGHPPTIECYLSERNVGLLCNIMGGLEESVNVNGAQAWQP